MSDQLPVDDRELVEAWTDQPDLFSHLDFDSATVKAAREFLHTGKTTSEDQVRAARIVAAAELGWSHRRIARELGHSRNTVAAVLRLAEKSGKVEPIQMRILGAVAEAVHADLELGNDMAERARKSGKVDRELAAIRRATWVGVEVVAGAGTQKGAGAGAPAVTVNVGPGSVVQVVQEYGQRLRELISDSESGGNTQPKPVDIESDASVVTDLVTPVDARDPEPAASGSADAAERERATGEGGGIGAGAAPADTDSTHRESL